MKKENMYKGSFEIDTDGNFKGEFSGNVNALSGVIIAISKAFAMAQAEVRREERKIHFPDEQFGGNK